MFNSICAEQEQELRVLIRKHGLESAEERILSRAQNAIALEPATGAPDAATISCLGGLPEVPHGWQWPQELTFLAQFDLEEIARHDFNQVLPARGLLLFFHDMYGWDQPGLPCHVEFIEDNPDGSLQVQRFPAPPGYLPMSLTSGGDGREVYKPLPIKPRSVISLPALYTRGGQEICSSQNGDDLTDAYLNLLSELGGRTHQLAGHHSFMDGDADEETWRATTGAAQPTPLDKSGKESQASEISEWMLLFQIDSDDRLGTMFNDAGFAYFMIRRADLVARRFDRVVASLWSS